MPKKLERKLQVEARKRWPGDEEQQNRYVYGTLRKTGWKPGGKTVHSSKSRRKAGNPVPKVTRKLSRSWTTPAG